ncbi:MAG: hypothetical protein K8F91_27670, partial [Candidatus Obscuribacterales bacterium]|nr:hypothetical protein [Candidatus Obscuribacterales bacterium]
FTVDGPWIVPGLPVQTSYRRPAVTVGNEIQLLVSDNYLISELPLARIMRCDLDIEQRLIMINPEKAADDSRALIIFNSAILTGVTAITVNGYLGHKGLVRQKCEPLLDHLSDIDQTHSHYAVCILETGDSMSLYLTSRKDSRSGKLETISRLLKGQREFLVQQTELERLVWNGNALTRAKTRF